MLAASAGLATPALAQSPKPLPAFVIDVRGASAGLGRDVQTAADLTLEPAQLPSRGLALTAGIHVYPIRRHGFAIGLGAEGVLVRAVAKGGTDAMGVVTPDVARRFEGVAAVLSLNFGGRDGWSYLSGGSGPLRFESSRGDVAHTTAPTRMTLNAGGGVRWFTNQHIAATFDVRAYLTRPAAATAGVAGRDRQRVLVMSVGISIR